MATQQRTAPRTQHTPKNQSPKNRDLRQPKQSLPSSKTLAFIPEKYRDLVALAILFVSILIFFSPVLDQTHVLNAGDNVASESFRPFVEKAQADGTSVPQWIPNIFSG